MYQQRGHTRILLEVARVRQYRGLPVCMNICEFVGPSVIESADAVSQILSNTLLRVTPSDDSGEVHSLRWSTIAYQCPKPGKQYKNLPETVIIGSAPDVESTPRICYSRSSLSKAYGNHEVDLILMPIFAAIHGLTSTVTAKTWQPKPLRESSHKLQHRLQLGIAAIKTDLSEQVWLQSRMAHQCGSSKDAPSCADATEATVSTAIANINALKPVSDQTTHMLPLKSTNCPLVTARTPSRLESLPSELWDSILDLVQDSDLTSHAVNKCESTNTGDFPALLLTCKVLHELSLDWFYRQKLTIRVKDWPTEPIRGFDLSKLPKRLLENVRKVRVDCSDLSFEQLREQHPVVAQIANIWRTANKLSSVKLFVPPHYQSLPLITQDPAVEQLLGPLLQPSDFINKIKWDSTDFTGDVGAGMTALQLATWYDDEELVHFILKQSYNGLNRVWEGIATPLDNAVQHGNIGIVKLLIDTGRVDVNIVGRYRFTPIHTAVAFGQEAILRLLLGTGQADLTLETIGDETPVQMAHRLGNENIAQLLVQSIQYGDARLESS